MNYFDPKVLAKLKNLYLRAKFVVDGLMIGIHPSRSKGFSSEFEEHREYTQGDDIRHIDWKAYGKSDRFFIKEYREATNLRGHFLLDCSSSMSYASNGWSKFDYGATLAASLAYLMLKQQDSVGLMTFTQKIDRVVPPLAAPGHLFAILKELEDTVPRGETAAGAILQELAGSLKRRGFIVLISDLLDRSEEVLRGLKQLRSRGSDVIVFHLMDPAELRFPFQHVTEFVDPETHERILTAPDSVRKDYLAEVQKFVGAYEQGCADLKVDYKLFDTAMPLELALSEYLFQRSRHY